MTLLVGLRGADGLVVATDSRGTFGDPRGITAQNDAQRKLYVTSKYTAVMTAGAGELGATVMKEILDKMTGVEGVTPVMQLVRQVALERYREWFPNFSIQPVQGQPQRPDLALMVAGYDVDAADHVAEPRMFQLLSQMDFAPMLHNYGFALCGVAQYALYLLNRLYQPDSSIEQLKALAAYVITETASQDGKVGGPVQMAMITAGGCKELATDQVREIIKHNDGRSEQLKKSFFKGGGS